MKQRLEELFARYMEQRDLHGECLSVEELCADCPELTEDLREYIRQYEMLDSMLAPASPYSERITETKEEGLPQFEGFRTIEQVGKGGGGKVYKLEDLKLERLVAAKVLQPDSRLKTTLEDFLREARALALFDDTRIVRIFEFRLEANPPFLLMEYVDGFQLDRLGQSLEYSQRAKIMAEIAEAIEGAHERGIQHRDLKPANILLDAKLCPKILDFGLSRGEEDHGHGKGTLPYMAPEQINPDLRIDNRTDVYALGVLFYELLCGVRPYKGETSKETIAAINEGMPKLPVETEPSVPEPLQAIALKAMEKNPDARYASVKEMALDLRRYLSGRPVMARPTLYQSTLAQRVSPHREQIREWQDLKLIYPHEAGTLQRAYDRLDSREEDWIVQSRVLSFSQISLYLGAFLLVIGSLLYTYAYFDVGTGLVKPLLALGIPLIGLNVLGILLFNRGRQAVAIAFFLAAAIILPQILLILFKETGWWKPLEGMEGQLFDDGPISNRQLQISGFLACVWACWLAFRTRTTALATIFIVLATAFHLTILADFGLREWFENGPMWDTFASHLLPLLLFFVLLGALTDRMKKPWFAQPGYFAACGLFVIIIELLALDGKLFEHLHVTLAWVHPQLGGEEITRLNTLAAMTLNGLLIYTTGWLLDRHGTPALKLPAQLLFIISPFSILEPICGITSDQGYPEFYNWFYICLAITIAYLSRFRQRKSFYFAGLINCGIGLYMITDRKDWFDDSWWAVVVVLVSLTVLAMGYGLNARERRHRRPA